MKKIIYALFLVTVSLLPYSCTLEQELDPNHTVTTAKKAEVILRLKTPSDYTPASRSLTYEDENTISDVYVFVFDKTNTLVRIEEGKNVSSSTGNSSPSYSGQGSFTVTLDASKTEADIYKLVVLANTKTIITNTIGFVVSDISDKTYSAVMTTIQGQIDGRMFPSSGGRIPMWGEIDKVFVSSSNSNQTLQLTRALARIDVGIGEATKDSGTDIWSWDGEDTSGTPIPFVLKHVYVIKPNNRYTVVPDVTKVAVGIPTVPSGTTAFSLDDSESKFAFDVRLTEGHTSRDIYIPEADIKMGTSGKPGDGNHTNRMAIVVGGCYNGNMTETFYRIDFAKDGSLINVLRNHLYQFNISKVSGDGYPDVETAYNSRSMNMAVDINEWDETDMGNIVFDGQNTLSVSQDEYYFSYEKRETAGEDNILYIKTDYIAPTNEGISGWKIDRIVDAIDGDKVDWVSLSPDAPDPGRPNDKTEVFVKVDENKSKVERKAIIWIAAGRLRYPVKVTQSPAPLWARSNIVWVPSSDHQTYPEGGYLTFAVTPEDNNKSVPANSQGVFFKWGSLVAISPAALDATIETYKGEHYPEGHILFSPTGTYNYDWKDIPYISDVTAPFDNNAKTEDDFATYNGNTGYNISTGKGDICRYISDQGWVSGGTKWRLPTADEYQQLIKEQSSIPNGDFNLMTVIPNGVSDDSGYGLNAYGYYQYDSGRWLGANATSSSATNPVVGVYFSVGGYRDSNDGMAYLAGHAGYCWTGSSSSLTHSFILSVLPNKVYGEGYDFRQSGLPVRCIRE